MNSRIKKCDCRRAGEIFAAGSVRRRALALLAWLATIVAAGSLCLTGRAQTNYITIQGSAYDPDQLAINVGDTVTWVHQDNTEHTVTSDDDLFNSGTLEYGDEFSLTFDTAGTYPYYCLFHGHGMSCVIVVSESTGNNPPAAPVNALPLNNASNQPVAVQLRASPFSDPDDVDFHGASEWIVRYANNNSVVVDSGVVTGGSLTNFSPAGLSEGTTYDWQVRYKDGRGAWSDYSAPTRFTTLVSFSEPGIGLRASYNNVADFNSPLIVLTNASVNFNWGNARPNRRITADNFAVRWEGSLLPQFTEQYAVQFQFRGQARVWVNNQLLIDEWNGCSFSQSRRGLISLVSGQLTAVRVEYVADPAGALAILRWTSPNLPMEVVPTTRLFPTHPDFFMLNRRQMIRNSALGLAALAMMPRRVLAQMDMSSSGTSPSLAAFQDGLRIPPVLTPVMRGKTQYYTMTMRAALAKVHRDLPTTIIWGFDGLFPGPTIKATKDQPVVIRHVSRLPDTHQYDGAEVAMMYPAVHLHGAHTAPQDDGHPREALPPGTFRDYHYPNQQRGTTLLYHDHSHGQTGLHVYHGLAGAYLIDDPEEQSLGLPQGDYDIPLMIQDRIFNSDGSFYYALDSNTRETGVLGDTILVNGVVWPYLKVARRKYRFRIINASNARSYYLQLSSGAPFVQIGTDGGLLPKPMPKTLVELAPFQRADVIIDFSVYAAGTKIILKNCESCVGCPDCSGPLATIMRFDVDAAATDDSVVPDCLSPWEDLPIDAQTVTRQFILNRQTTANGTIWTINGQTFDVNNPPLVQVKHGDVERWNFVNLTGHRHPVHIHLIQFQVLDINGVPQDPSMHGWKDTLVAPPNGQITVAARFKGYLGKFLFHCHNLEHEDLGMMADYEIIP